MNPYLRLDILTSDRMGITMEILDKVYKKNINLISLEAFQKRVCIKIENISEEKKKSLIEDLHKIEDVVTVNEIELLYIEQNERRLLAVINSVDEGIIAIDKRYRINVFNDYCEVLFNCGRDKILDSDIRDFLGDDENITGLVSEGTEFSNVDLCAVNNGVEIRCIITGRPFKDDNDNTIGAVISVKDIKKARQLVNLITTAQEDAFKDIIGSSIQMERVKKLAATVAKSDSTVMLRGESGTGKELFAKAIHNLSNRKNNSFVTINCAALPETLLESELFGYEKGSFTGAMQRGKDGLFIEANGGTLFLDEIGEMSIFLQAKLLRVLQEGKIRRIGSNKEERVDVRIITATNKNLEDMIKSKEFREDLYYRLNVIPICLPSLKERLEDIPMLVKFFIENLNRKLNKQIKGAHVEFVNMLMNYDWPGNIRELQNVIERTMNLCEGDVLRSKDLILNIENKDNIQMNIIPESQYTDKPLKDIMDDFEKEVLSKILKGKKSYRKAAKSLGVSHTTILNKIKKYGIEM